MNITIILKPLIQMFFLLTLIAHSHRNWKTWLTKLAVFPFVSCTKRVGLSPSILQILGNEKGYETNGDFKTL